MLLPKRKSREIRKYEDTLLSVTSRLGDEHRQMVLELASQLDAIKRPQEVRKDGRQQVGTANV